jgi:hypothetical protein
LRSPAPRVDSSVWRGKMCSLRFTRKLAVGAAIALALLSAGALPFYSGDHTKYETIEATAMGTGTQLGANIGVSLEIYDYSTPADRQILIQAFEKGQNQGLVNALSRMKVVGHCSITGTLGYDVAYIRMIPTPTGRRIRFVTNATALRGSLLGHANDSLQPDRWRD